MLFDTHAHMDDRRFDDDRDELLTSLPGLGVELVMNPGCSLESSRAAIALAAKYPHVYAAVGSHPDAADEVTDQVIQEYRQLCRHPKVKVDDIWVFVSHSSKDFEKVRKLIEWARYGEMHVTH